MTIPGERRLESGWPNIRRLPASRDVIAVVRAGAILALVDGICAYGIRALVFHETSIAATFQGIAAALLGPSARSGGARTALTGAAMHATVACFWVALYAVAYTWVRPLRRMAAGSLGIARAGAPLGAGIWLAMNYVAFPIIGLNPAPSGSLNFRVLLVLHIIVVGPLIVALVRPQTVAPDA